MDKKDAQPDAEPKHVRDMLEKAIIASTLPEHKATDAEFMRASIRLANAFAKDALAALAQADTEPVGWENERSIGMREAVHIMHAANLSTAELKLVDKHCDWQAFKHAFNAVMKDRAARMLASIDAIETERAYTAPPRPDVEPVAWPTDKQVEEACRAFWQDGDDATYIAKDMANMRRTLEAVAPPRPDYELSAIAAAIGSSRFMDPPDGGDVSLAEQVCRMREALERAEARPDASAGLIEAAEFADQMFSLSFDRCDIDTYEIMELGERLGLLEQVFYNPKIHDGEIDADEGDMIYVRSAKGKALRARAADRSGG